MPWGESANKGRFNDRPTEINKDKMKASKRTLSGRKRQGITITASHQSATNHQLKRSDSKLQQDQLDKCSNL